MAKKTKVSSLYEEYKNQLPPEEQVAAQQQAAVTAEETGPGPAAPEGYKPLSSGERKQWNDLIRFVNSKGMLGSTELDKRDRSMGTELMEEYRKANPSFTLTPDRIPHVQYEFQLIRDSGALPNVNAESFAGRSTLPWFKGELSKKKVSDVDGWFGSLTSQQAYPEIAPFSDDPEKRMFGTDYDAADQYFRTSKGWGGRKPSL